MPVRRIASLAFAFAFAPAAASASAADVAAPKDAAVVRRVQAGGEQIYACTAPAGTGAFAWTLVGPDALLFDADGSTFGMHTAGPTWTAADGSAIVADGVDPIARVDRAGNVPSLLLRVVSASGTGALSDVTMVARTETSGGVAPLEGCDAAHQGARVGERYTAVYTFYR